MLGEILIILALSAAYATSLFVLFRYFGKSRSSHVLLVECIEPNKILAGDRNRRLLKLTPSAALAAGLLWLESSALVLVTGTLGTTSNVAPMLPGRSTALAILLCSAAFQYLARKFILASVAYPVVLLLTGIIGFGAVIDIAAGGSGAARLEIIFQVAGWLQITAAVAFALGTLILSAETLAVLIRAVLAHVAGAGARILGALAVVAVWPYMPPASAIALLLAAVLVPGVATALTSIAALAYTLPGPG